MFRVEIAPAPCSRSSMMVASTIASPVPDITSGALARSRTLAARERRGRCGAGGFFRLAPAAVSLLMLCWLALHRAGVALAERLFLASAGLEPPLDFAWRELEAEGTLHGNAYALRPSGGRQATTRRKLGRSSARRVGR